MDAQQKRRADLTKILAKIYYRMEDDEWDLEDDEYRLLNDANGPEIVDIAYRHHFNIPKLSQKADELIDEHNAMVERKLIRDIKNLKRELTSIRPRVRKVRTPPPDPEEIDRRILEETIDEVLEPVNENDDEEEEDFLGMDIEAQLKERGILGAKGFQTQVEAQSSTAVSLQRAGGSAVTLPDLIVTHPDFNPPAEEDFSAPTNQEMVDIGMMTGVVGRRLYDRINDKAPSRSVSHIRDNQSLPPATPQMINIPRVSTLEPVFPEIDMSPIHDAAIIQKRVTDIPNPSPLTKLRSATFSKPTTPAQNEVPDVQINEPERTMSPIRAQAQASSTPGISLNRTSLTARSDAFLKLAEEIAQKNEQQKKKPRRRRARPLNSAAPVVEEELWEKNVKMVKKYQKPIPKPSPSAAKVSLQLVNFLVLDPDDYEPDYVDSDDELEIATEKQPQQPTSAIVEAAVPNVAEATGDQGSLEIPEVNQQDYDIPLMELDNVLNFKPPPAVPKSREIFVGKRPRLSTAPVDESSRQQPSTSVDTSMIGDRVSSFGPFAENQQSTPLDPPTAEVAPQPVGSTGAIPKQKPTRKKLTKDDFVFARLEQQSNKNAEIAQQVMEAQKKKSDAERAKLPRPEGTDENGKVWYKRVEGKTDNYIEYEGWGGKVERVSEYGLETFALYMQIRIIMARNKRWTMSFEELLPQISLRKNHSKRGRIEDRLFHLEDEKFVKLGRTDDEDHILTVEIPIKVKEKAADDSGACASSN